MQLPDYKNMTKKEAKVYFEKFVAEIPTRIEVLEKYANEKCKANLVFDYTVESLVPLWSWFEGIMTVEEKTPEEIQRDLDVLADWMHEIVLQNTTRPSLETIAISLDIGVYFAEVFRRNNADKIYWDYVSKNKRYISYNHPVLKGFINDGDMDPNLLIKTCVSCSLDKKEPDMLVDLYNVWSGDIF